MAVCKLPFLPWAVGLACSLASYGAFAQTPATAAAAGTNAAYEDRVIEGLAPAPVDDLGQDSASRRKGWPLDVQIETRLQSDNTRWQTGASGQSRQRTLIDWRVRLMLETPRFGVLSADAVLSPQKPNAPALTGGATQSKWPVFTLSQRGLPMPGGWLVDNQLGVTYLPTPPLAQEATRVYVPGPSLLGMHTDWRKTVGQSGNKTGSWRWGAGYGRPATIWLSPGAALALQPGNVMGAYVQHEGTKWAGAIRGAEGHDVPSPSQSNATMATRNVGATVRWLPRPNASVQAHAVYGEQTTAGGTPAKAYGVWLDAQWRQGAWRHDFGAYHLQPGLQWLGLPMSNDLQGAWWRGSRSSLRWSVDAQVDVLRSISAPQDWGYYATVSGRWRLSRSWGLAAGLGLRNYRGKSWELWSEAYHNNRWGTTTWRTNTRRSDAHMPSEEVQHSASVNHEWAPFGQARDSGLDWRLSTGYGISTIWRVDQPRWRTRHALSLQGDWPISNNITARAAAQIERDNAGSRYQMISAGLNWRISPQWQLDLQYNLNRGVSRIPVSFNPLQPPVLAQTNTQKGQSVWLVLRYQHQSGQRTVPLGGAPGDGSGRIRGVVFLDSNRDGVQQANEAGAGNVTVVLNGRYNATTDAQGRFDFPYVVAGEYTLQVQNETLPLPWVAPAEPLRFTLGVRQNKTLLVGVRQSGFD